LRLATAVMSRKVRLLWVCANLVLLCGFSFHAFSKNIAGLLSRGDGDFFLITIKEQLKWMPLAAGFYSNPFEGMGDIWFNRNALLLPESILPHFLTNGMSPTDTEYIVTMCVIVSIELFVSVLVLARSCGVKWIAAMAAAWMLPLLAQPYFGQCLIYPIMYWSPSTGTMIAEVAIILAAVACLGQGSFTGRKLSRQDFGLALVILLLLGHLMVALPTTVVIWCPTLSFVAVAMIIAATGRERMVKFFTVAATGGVLLAAGYGFFLFGLFDFTAPIFFDQQLHNTALDETYISIWFGHAPYGTMGPAFLATALAGMLLAVVKGGRMLRSIALSCGLLLASIMVFGHLSIMWKIWSAPKALYFEFALWPVYAVFAGFAVIGIPSHLAGLVYKIWRRPRGAFGGRLGEGFAMLLILFGVPAWAFVLDHPVDNRSRAYPLPLTKPPLIAMLQERVGLMPNAPYRGRVIAMNLVDRHQPQGWMNMSDVINPRTAATGNDYYWNGLWAYDIPTLFEYSPTTSPALYLATIRLLGRPDDRQIRNVIFLRRPNAHAMALLGVRFVISDAPLPSPFILAMTEATSKNERLYLYKVPDPNLGTWSPTTVASVHSFAEALRQIADPRFDGRRTAIAFDSVGDTVPALAAARDVAVRMIPGGFSVQAKSNAASLVVLPFLYSKCLVLHDHIRRGKTPRLIPVNAIETGVIFTRSISADVQYFIGPFNNARCRIDDAHTFARLLRAR
jgi:hypothetical protein